MKPVNSGSIPGGWRVGPVNMARLVLASLLLAGAAVTHAATLYKWTDDAGVTHFSQNRPPAGTDPERIHVKSAHDGARGATARTRRIRCRDFRGALDQLQAADVGEAERDRWRAAKRTARAGIAEWCPRDGGN